MNWTIQKRSDAPLRTLVIGVPVKSGYEPDALGLSRRPVAVQSTY